MAHTRTLSIDGTFTLADLDELAEQIKNTASPTMPTDLNYIGWSDQARRRFKGKVTVVFEELAWAPAPTPDNPS
jgi:hypothetical protein